MFPVSGNLRVLQVHNRYAPGWGGEERVVELETRLLEKWGHTVEQFQVSNASLKQASTIRQMVAVPGFLWSQASYKRLRQLIVRFVPDVIHVHNTFPLFSPSVFWAARHEHIPVVQTLHNFRYTCANAVLLRDDRPCEDCVGGSLWPGLRHRCYANSFVRTAAVVGMNALHWKIGTYTEKIDAFIVLNNWSRDIFVRAGLPREKMFVKPNFVPASSLGGVPRSPRVVFAGTMTRNKGLHVLLDAWRRVTMKNSQLLLIGDGPESEALRKQFSNLPGVTWSGSLAHAEVLNFIRGSRALVLPTLVYENSPMVLLEAFSVATPVVVPDLGSMKTMVGHQREGLIFRAGDPAALADALREVLCAPGKVWSKWSAGAHQAHARLYSENANYQQLISIYRSVIEKHANVQRCLGDETNVAALKSAACASVPFEAD